MAEGNPGQVLRTSWLVYSWVLFDTLCQSVPQRLYKVESHKLLEQLDEFVLDKGEDAPMSMVAWPKTKTIACGINSSEESLKSGSNQNCRLFTIEDSK